MHRDGISEKQWEEGKRSTSKLFAALFGCQTRVVVLVSAEQPLKRKERCRGRDPGRRDVSGDVLGSQQEL